MSGIPIFLVDNTSSRESCRLLESACGVFRSYGHEALSVYGVEIAVQPVQEFIKSVDSAWYIPKAVEATGKVKASGGDFYKQASIFLGATPEADYDGKLVSTAASFLTLVRNTFKLIANTSAGLKFLGTLGVTYLAPRVKVLGLTKSGFSVYCAVHDIVVNGMKFYDHAIYSNDADRGKKMVVNVLSIFASLNSACLNGFGALDTLFGSALAQEGKQGLSSFAFFSWKIGGSFSGLVHNYFDQ